MVGKSEASYKKFKNLLYAIWQLVLANPLTANLITEENIQLGKEQNHIMLIQLASMVVRMKYSMWEWSVFCFAQIYSTFFLVSSLHCSFSCPPFCLHSSPCPTVRQNSLCKVHLSKWLFSAPLHCKIRGYRGIEESRHHLTIWGFFSLFALNISYLLCCNCSYFTKKKKTHINSSSPSSKTDTRTSSYNSPASTGKSWVENNILEQGRQFPITCSQPWRSVQLYRSNPA